MTGTVVDTQPHTAEAIAQQIVDAQANPVADQFHALWYHAKHTWAMTRYKGVPTLKCPLDLQIYHELLWILKPSLVIETGTCFGGSALWFADQLEPWGGRVVSIDIENKRNTPKAALPGNEWDEVQHDRIEFHVGSSLDDEIKTRCRTLAQTAEGAVMVSLDSDHRAAHVYEELQVYAPLVTPGSYCVVEDTNISGRPLVCDDPGPGAAADAWLESHPEFRPNALCERNILTMHPKGWLWRER